MAALRALPPARSPSVRPGGCKGQVSLEMALLLMAVIVTVAVFAMGLRTFVHTVGSGWSQAMSVVADEVVRRAMESSAGS